MAIKTKSALQAAIAAVRLQHLSLFPAKVRDVVTDLIDSITVTAGIVAASIIDSTAAGRAILTAADAAAQRAAIQAFSTSGGTIAGNVTIGGAGLGVTTVSVIGEAAPSFFIYNYQAAINAGSVSFVKGRGTAAAPSPVQLADILGALNFRGYGNVTTAVNAAILDVLAISATPSDTDMGTRFRFRNAPTGSVTTAETLGIASTGLTWGGAANFFLSAVRGFLFRQYAAASLPAQASGETIQSSDTGSLLTSDGTQWTSPGTLNQNAKTANFTISLPAGHALDAVFFNNGTANAVTGGVRIGTTNGGADVVAAQAVAASTIGHVADSALLKRVFSKTAATTLYVQAVTAWNSASVDFSFATSKRF